MNSWIRRLSVLYLLLQLAYGVTALAGGPPEKPETALDSDFFSPFGGNLQQTFRAASLEHKQVLLFFGAHDCHYCEQMRQQVFTDARVRDFYQQHYRVIALDIDSPKPMLDEAGQSTTVQDFARANRIRLTPTMIYFDEHHEAIYRQTGYIIDKKVFIELGKSLLPKAVQP